MKKYFPKKIEDIKLWQFQKLATLREDSSLEDYKNVLIDVLNIKDVNLISTVDVLDFKDLVDDIALTNSPIIQKFTLNGVQYGFINNLKDMSFGEYIDLVTFLSSDNGGWKDMHKAIAVLYRPIKAIDGDFYSVKKYKGVDHADIFKELPATIGRSVQLFFWSINSKL